MNGSVTNNLYTLLPDAFKLTENTWGLVLIDIRLVPLFLAAIGCVIFIVCVLSYMHQRGFHARLLRSGIMLGSIVLLVGVGISAVSFTRTAAFQDFAAGVVLLGVVILGGSMLMASHTVYAN